MLSLAMTSDFNSPLMSLLWDGREGGAKSCFSWLETISSSPRSLSISDDRPQSADIPKDIRQTAYGRIHLRCNLLKECLCRGRVRHYPSLLFVRGVLFCVETNSQRGRKGHQCGRLLSEWGKLNRNFSHHRTRWARENAAAPSCSTLAGDVQLLDWPSWQVFVCALKIARRSVSRCWPSTSSIRIMSPELSTKPEHLEIYFGTRLIRLVLQNVLRSYIWNLLPKIQSPCSKLQDLLPPEISCSNTCLRVGET